MSIHQIPTDKDSSAAAFRAWLDGRPIEYRDKNGDWNPSPNEGMSLMIGFPMRPKPIDHPLAEADEKAYRAHYDARDYDINIPSAKVAAHQSFHAGIAYERARQARSNHQKDQQ